MIRALLLVLILTMPVEAQTARVLSGEHTDFTRLVVELPGAAGWTLGRTGTGYSFAFSTQGPTTYDLSGVWQRIPRTRLAAVTADKETGVLGLQLGCDCHIFPFEYGAGIIVLDIKPGPAPAGSAFEAPFHLPGFESPTVETGAGPGYDWLADQRSGSDGRASAPPSLPLPLETGAISLEPLRDELLEQIARGAAEGIVDMELPGKPQKVSEIDRGSLPWSNIRIGEEAGINVNGPGAFAEGQRPQSACADPSLLNLPDWSGGLSPMDLLAEGRSGLYGEFDAPEPAEIRHAVQGLLYLGFGAEALQTADLLAKEAPGEDMAMLRSIALLIDGESDPQTPFAEMLGCAGPAALWAALAHDRLPVGRGLNRDAILQAFAALPAHLRQHLGPGLADRFLALDDADAARMIRDSLERTPDSDKAAVALLDAKSEMQKGDPETAQSHAETAVALDGDQADNLVALVETHLRTLDPLSPDIAEALQALRGEVEGTEQAPVVDRAIVLALALSGQTGAAFQATSARDEAAADLWRVTTDRAEDDAFLLHAVLPPDETVPDIVPEVRLMIAERLLALGFPDSAMVWIGPVLPGDPPHLRYMAAQAAYGQGDAHGAIALTEGLESREALALRAKALVQLDDLAGAEAALAAAGEAEDSVRLGPWKGDWGGLDPALPAPWLQAASLVTAPPPAVSNGLLGRGDQAIDASVAARVSIETLLSSIPGPTQD